MSHLPPTIESHATSVLALNIESISLNDDQFAQLCLDNRDLRLELTSKGELIIMPPTGSKTGLRSAIIIQRLANWAERNRRGLAFDSSTGFTLPDGSKRSPDASWVRRERWDALSKEQQDGFAPIAPDFLIELLSPSDSWNLLQQKMLDYLDNGVRLAWLIDPEQRRVYIYRPDQPVEILENPATVSADSLLPGFDLDLQEIY
ncbi:MAG: Uma2 family endonuclease [Pyrinomonadaceae bacterium]